MSLQTDTICLVIHMLKTWTSSYRWEQKAKLEAKLHQTTSAAAAVASGVGPIHNSVPSNPSSAPGFFIHPSDVIPPTPKTTPLFMTPPLTPPNEAVSAAFSSELAHLFPGSMMESGPVNLAAHKNTQKTKPVSVILLYFWTVLFYLSGRSIITF